MTGSKVAGPLLKVEKVVARKAPSSRGRSVPPTNPCHLIRRKRHKYWTAVPTMPRELHARESSKVTMLGPALDSCTNEWAATNRQDGVGSSDHWSTDRESVRPGRLGRRTRGQDKGESVLAEVD